MLETELLSIDERKKKVRQWVYHLDRSFNELLWDHPSKLDKLNRLKPNVIEEFWKRYDEFDQRCIEYIDGKIEWDGDVIQMEIMPLTKVHFPVLETDRDVESFSREIFTWLVLQVKDL